MKDAHGQRADDDEGAGRHQDEAGVCQRYRGRMPHGPAAWRRHVVSGPDAAAEPDAGRESGAAATSIAGMLRPAVGKPCRQPPSLSAERPDGDDREPRLAPSRAHVAPWRASSTTRLTREVWPGDRRSLREASPFAGADRRAISSERGGAAPSALDPRDGGHALAALVAGAKPRHDAGVPRDQALGPLPAVALGRHARPMGGPAERARHRRGERGCAPRC